MRPNLLPFVLPALAAAALGTASPALAQLRIASWNISNYTGGRTAALTTAIFDAYQGRSMYPDIIIGQEFMSQAAVDEFRALLNAAEVARGGPPNSWGAAPFIDGPDTDSAFFFRYSKVAFLGATIAAYGSGDTDNQPRHTIRYDLRPVGYAAAPGASLACYSVHLKAQGGTNDAGRRLVEAQRIRDNAEGQNAVNLSGNPVPGTGLPSGWNFLVAGDMNAQSATEPFYVEFVGSQANNTGRFFDPINSPGTWNNNPAFRIIHTQDPAGAGGMDDRHDQILLSSSLINNAGIASGPGFGYIGNPNIAYSTTTWNDPNHSYRAWGADGSTCPTSGNCGPNLRVAGNTMVGAAIAQALIDVCNGSGHLPVVLDLRVPPKVTSSVTIDFGQVEQGAPAAAAITVGNAGDAALWTAGGIAMLSYSLSASSGFTAPGGTFTDAAGGTENSHTITMDTATPGARAGTITIASNAPDQPVRTITLIGEVIAPTPACQTDRDGDGAITPADLALFVSDWFTSLSTGTLAADFDGNGQISPADVAAFVSQWFTEVSTGC